MKKILIIFLLFFSVINITNAIPIPALAIWYEFIIFLIPATLSFFSIIYFYFRKYIFSVNIFLLFLSIFLYFIHFIITDDYLLLFKFEYIIFILLWIILFIIYLIKDIKAKVLNYITVFILIIINIFLIKVDYNLYSLNKFCIKSETIINKNFSLNKCIIKDNKVLVYFKDSKWFDFIIWIYKENILKNQPILSINWYSYEFRYSKEKYCWRKCTNLIEEISK